MKLGIVGHAAEKFTAETEAKARQAIQQLFTYTKPNLVISGRSPMGGIDVWAIEEAKLAGIDTKEYAPRQHTWDGEYGFKARNLDIAHNSDLVVVIVVGELPPGYHGMQFKDCYHCRGRTEPHIKSGGCWTAWKAARREWIIL